MVAPVQYWAYMSLAIVHDDEPLAAILDQQDDEHGRDGGQRQGVDYLAMAAESKTVSKKLNIKKSLERLRSKLPQSVTRLPIYDRDQILSEIESELPDNAIDQGTDKLQYLNQLIDDTDPDLLMPPESEVFFVNYLKIKIK